MVELTGTGPNFDSMTEEAIVDLAKCGQAGAVEYIISRYRPFVHSATAPYRDSDRYVAYNQAGIIGLFKAIRDFKPELGMAFRAFAELSIAKHIDLKAPSDLLGSDTKVRSAARGRASKVPENQTPLSTLERTILRYYLEGRSYSEIGCLIDRQPKSVDNALQRIKKKISVARSLG